jgi:hypothetical protein
MHVRLIRASRIGVIALAAAAAIGCDSVTGIDNLEQFTWGEAPPGEPVEDGIDVSQALGDVFILGEMNAPTRCYTLEADLERSGGQLTLTVDATSSQSGGCEQSTGAYRYTAVLRNLEAREYQLRVIHAVAGGETRDFTVAVTLQ